MARIGLTWPTLCAAALATLAGLAACTGAPELPPTLGGCDGGGNTRCETVSAGGGVSSPEGGAVSGEGGGVFDDDAASGCGIGTAIAAANPACAPCLGQFCCAAAALCANNNACSFIVENCTGCSSGGCVGSCQLTQQSAMVTTANAAFDDLSLCLNHNCGTQCPALNIFAAAVDP